MQKQIKGCLECLYLMIIFGICLIPLLAMSVKASDNEKENRTLAAIPQRYGQEGINWRSWANTLKIILHFVRNWYQWMQ